MVTKHPSLHAVFEIGQILEPVTIFIKAVRLTEAQKAAQLDVHKEQNFKDSRGKLVKINVERKSLTCLNSLFGDADVVAFHFAVIMLWDAASVVGAVLSELEKENLANSAISSVGDDFDAVCGCWLDDHLDWLFDVGRLEIEDEGSCSLLAKWATLCGSIEKLSCVALKGRKWSVAAVVESCD